MNGFGQRAGRLAAGLAMVWFGSAAALAGAPGNNWNEPRKPFRIHGNTYYVGTAGLTSILITSDYGHVLIDGALPESAAQIQANIESLGFRIQDVKAILNTHAHVDHAGGIAALQKASGAPVYLLRPSEEVLRTGRLSSDDPQATVKMPKMPKVERAWIVQDDQLLGVGGIRLRALATPGHTPGGTSWTWEGCDGSRCLTFLYADSLSPVSGDKYRFRDHPETVKAFEQSFARLEAARCDVLVTPHPEASNLFARIEANAGNMEALKNEAACRDYVKQARENLARRLASEG